MLESITISNFKAIKEPGLLRLEGLTNVNYLVGENGSGKSSVLEGLFGRSKVEVEEKVKLTLKLSDSQIDSLQTDKKRFTENQINQLKKIKIETPSSKEMPIIISKQISEKIAIITREDKDSTDICKRAIDFLKYISVRALTSNEVQYTELRESYDKSLNEYNNYILNFKFNPSYIENHNLLKDFLNKYFFKGNEVFDINRDANKDLLRVVTTKYDIVELNSLAGGYQFLFGLYSSITKAINYNELNTVVLIEEPEIALHPNMQKLIPEIVRSFAEKGVQFLISTHSPFIISEAGKIAEEERAKGNDPSQKVYLIEDGQTKSISGVLGEGKNGYWGTNVVDTVCDMLGTGFDDIVGQGLNSSITQVIKSKTIFCEGSENESFVDADIYQLIFGYRIGDCRINFVSCGGSNDTVKIFKLTNQIQDKVKTTNQNLIILDGDKKGEYDGVNCLKMSCLEAYLLAPEIVLKKWNFNDDQKYKYLEKYKTLQLENKDHKNSNEIKNFLNQEKICLLKDFSYLDLAKLITSQTTVYQELHDCIFGSSLKPDK